MELASVFRKLEGPTRLPFIAFNGDLDSRWFIKSFQQLAISRRVEARSLSVAAANLGNVSS
jgi:hypothetical protein